MRFADASLEMKMILFLSCALRFLYSFLGITPYLFSSELF